MSQEIEPEESEEEGPSTVGLPLEEAKNKKKKLEKLNSLEKSGDEVVPQKPRELPYVSVPPLPSVYRKTTEAKTSDTSVPVRLGPAYKSRAPVEDVADPEGVLEEILDMSVSVPLKNLLGNAPNIREALKKNISKTRKSPTKEAKEVATFLFAGPTNEYNLATDYKVGGDPFLQFHQNSGEVPTSLYTARESEKLRSVFPKINSVDREEAIVDSGSQIVSMSAEVATRMGLCWDPEITINMQSANKSIDRTLGLVRNVPFQFGDVTLYLQVHVLKSPAYTILLGRTFDTLCRSNVQTETDGSAVITIEDPNSGRKVTVPTYERGQVPRQKDIKKEAEAF